MATQTSAPTPPFGFFELNELDPEFRTDPHARLGLMRDRCPVSRDPTMKRVLMTRHADVRTVLADPHLYRDFYKGAPDNPMRLMNDQDNLEIAAALGEAYGEAEQRSLSILFMDDPDHARIRGIIHRHFQPRVVAYRPQIERVVDTALDRVAGRPGFDAIADFAIYVPIHVIAEILGVADADLEAFKRWSDALIVQFNPAATQEQRRARIDAIVALLGYFGRLIDERRRHPRDDLISAILADQAAGAPITDRELADNLLTLLVAGHLTTTDLIGNGIWLLLTHPDQLARLKVEPGLVAGMVEEVLRYQPPVGMTARVTTVDGVFGGCPYQAGDTLGTSLMAANRDPEAFPDPGRFDIGRKANRHVSFGGGAHVCLGASLARLEGQVALAGLFNRFPDLRLADPAAPPRWRATPFFRGLERLDLLV
jgi:cytochrome P450